MICALCEEPARGVCAFCGAGVCRDHRETRRLGHGWLATGQAGWGRIPGTKEDRVVVEDAGWCGACTIHESIKP